MDLKQFECDSSGNEVRRSIRQ